VLSCDRPIVSFVPLTQCKKLGIECLSEVTITTPYFTQVMRMKLQEEVWSKIVDRWNYKNGKVSYNSFTFYTGKILILSKGPRAKTSVFCILCVCVCGGGGEIKVQHKDLVFTGFLTVSCSPSVALDI
jgi:hypothetical protein